MTEQQNAVTFDRSAFRTWLDAPYNPAVDGSPANRDAAAGVSTAFQRLDGEGGQLAEMVLDALPKDESSPWQYGPAVSGLRVWATAGPEGAPDGGLVGEVIVDGAGLSLGFVPAVELVSVDEHAVVPGYEAAELALTVLADRVNRAAAWFRSMYAPTSTSGSADDDIVDAEIVG